MCRSQIELEPCNPGALLRGDVAHRNGACDLLDRPEPPFIAGTTIDRHRLQINPLDSLGAVLVERRACKRIALFEGIVWLSDGFHRVFLGPGERSAAALFVQPEDVLDFLAVVPLLSAAWGELVARNLDFPGKNTAARYSPSQAL